MCLGILYRKNTLTYTHSKHTRIIGTFFVLCCWCFLKTQTFSWQFSVFFITYLHVDEMQTRRWDNRQSQQCVKSLIITGEKVENSTSCIKKRRKFVFTVIKGCFLQSLSVQVLRGSFLGVYFNLKIFLYLWKFSSLPYCTFYILFVFLVIFFSSLSCVLSYSGAFWVWRISDDTTKVIHILLFQIFNPLTPNLFPTKKKEIVLTVLLSSRW